MRIHNENNTIVGLASILGYLMQVEGYSLKVTDGRSDFNIRLSNPGKLEVLVLSRVVLLSFGLSKALEGSRLLARVTCHSILQKIYAAHLAVALQKPLQAIHFRDQKTFLALLHLSRRFEVDEPGTIPIY